MDSNDLLLVTNWNFGVSVLVPVALAYKIDGIKKFSTSLDLHRRRKMASETPESLKLVERLVDLSEEHPYICKNLKFYVNYIHRGGRKSLRGIPSKEVFDVIVYVSIKENILSYCLQAELLSSHDVETFYGLFSETESNRVRRRKEVNDLYEKTMNSFGGVEK